MSNAKSVIKKVLNNTILIRLILVVIIAAAFTINNKNYLGAYNLKNLMSNMEPYFIMSMGVTFVLMIGSIDLSIGTMCSASACLMAILVPKIGIWAYFLALLFGVIGGMVNGFLVAKLKMVSFIATLGTMSIWSSMAYFITNTKAVTLSQDLWNYVNFDSIYLGVIPVTFLVCLLIWAILFRVQASTPFGKGIFATGVNEKAAQIAGVNVTRIKMKSFIISGLFSAISGIILISKQKGAAPYAGDAMTMLAIAAVVLGGTALEGGKGGMLSTLIGSLMVVMIQTGLNIVGITSYYQDIVFGVLIILAIYFSADRSDRHAMVK